jgi:hypothetical protein
MVFRPSTLFCQFQLTDLGCNAAVSSESEQPESESNTCQLGFRIYEDTDCIQIDCCDIQLLCIVIAFIQSLPLGFWEHVAMVSQVALIRARV